MEKNNQNLLQKLTQILNVDKIISPEDIEAIRDALIGVLANNKKELESLTDETKQAVNSILDKVLNEHDTYLEKTKQIAQEAKSETTEAINSTLKSLEEVKALCKEVMECKPENGEDADEEYVIGEVLNRIKLPEYKEIVLDDGGAIVDKINSLPVNEENQIDAKHIKNLPEGKGGRVISGGVTRKIVEQMIAASGGGGSPGGSTTQLQYNNAGTFGGISGATTNGTSVTLTSPTFITPALGTPASGVATNLTGTAAGLTAGNVTTNANLTGVVTSTGNATAIADAALSIAKTSGLQAALDSKQATGNYITALTGDVTASGPGSAASTLATVNSNVGSFGSATQSLTATVNAKGLVTAISAQTVTPAVGSITGLGTGVGTALAVNVGSAGAFVTFNGALGTPSSGTVTNLTGTASININGTVGATTPTTGAFTTASTSSTLTASTTIELGHATDTTLSRSAAGQLAVEGVDVLTTSNTKTVTNKTLTTPTINGATLNGDIQIDATPNSDDTWNGKSTNTFNAGGTIAQFDCVYMTSSSTWALTDADAIGTGGNTLVMMAGEAGTNGNPLRVIEPGSWVRNDAWAWTVGGVLYLDTATAGGMTQTVPSGTDDVVKIVGHAVSADVIYFNPSVNWIIRV